MDLTYFTTLTFIFEKIKIFKDTEMVRILRSRRQIGPGNFFGGRGDATLALQHFRTLTEDHLQ